MANFLTTMYNTNDPNVEPPLLEEYDAKKVKLQTDMKDPKAVKLEQFRAKLLEFNANLNLHANEGNTSEQNGPNVGKTLPGTNVKTPLLASSPKVGQTFADYTPTLDNYGRSFERYTSAFKVRTADMKAKEEAEYDATHTPTFMHNPTTGMGTDVVMADFVDSGEGIKQRELQQIHVDAHEELKNKPMQAPTLNTSATELELAFPHSTYMEANPTIEDMGEYIRETNIGVEPSVNSIGEYIRETNVGAEPLIEHSSDDIHSSSFLTSPTVDGIGDGIHTTTIGTDPSITEIGEFVKPNPYVNEHEFNTYYEGFTSLLDLSEYEALDITNEDYAFLERYGKFEELRTQFETDPEKTEIEPHMLYVSSDVLTFDVNDVELDTGFYVQYDIDPDEKWHEFSEHVDKASDSRLTMSGYTQGTIDTRQHLRGGASDDWIDTSDMEFYGQEARDFSNYNRELKFNKTTGLTDKDKDTRITQKGIPIPNDLKDGNKIISKESDVETTNLGEQLNTGFNTFYSTSNDFDKTTGLSDKSGDGRQTIKGYPIPNNLEEGNNVISKDKTSESIDTGFNTFYSTSNDFDKTTGLSDKSGDGRQTIKGYPIPNNLEEGNNVISKDKTSESIDTGFNTFYSTSNDFDKTTGLSDKSGDGRQTIKGYPISEDVEHGHEVLSIQPDLQDDTILDTHLRDTYITTWYRNSDALPFPTLRGLHDLHDKTGIIDGEDKKQRKTQTGFPIAEDSTHGNLKISYPTQFGTSDQATSRIDSLWINTRRVSFYGKAQYVKTKKGKFDGITEDASDPEVARKVDQLWDLDPSLFSKFDLINGLRHSQHTSDDNGLRETQTGFPQWDADGGKREKAFLTTTTSDDWVNTSDMEFYGQKARNFDDLNRILKFDNASGLSDRLGDTRVSKTQGLFTWKAEPAVNRNEKDKFSTDEFGRQRKSAAFDTLHPNNEELYQEHFSRYPGGPDWAEQQETAWKDYVNGYVTNPLNSVAELVGNSVSTLVSSTMDLTNLLFPFKQLWDPILQVATFQAYRAIPYRWALIPWFWPFANQTLAEFLSIYKGIGLPGVGDVESPLQFTDSLSQAYFSGTWIMAKGTTKSITNKVVSELSKGNIVKVSSSGTYLTDVLNPYTTDTLHEGFRGYYSIKNLQARSGQKAWAGEREEQVNFGTEFYWDMFFSYPIENAEHLPAMPYKGWIPVMNWNIVGTQMGTTQVETLAGSVTLPDSYQLPTSLQITLPETSYYDVDTWMRAYFAAIFFVDNDPNTNQIPNLHILPYKQQTMYITIYWLTDQWMPVRSKTYICIPEFKFQYNGASEKNLKTQDVAFNIVGTKGYTDVNYVTAGGASKSIRVLE